MIEKIKKYFENEKKLTITTLLLLIIIPSIWLIPKGAPWSHDIQYHYTRLVGLTETMKNGDFIALIHDSLNGFGYANGIFYSNIFFYPASLLSLCGISYINAYKIMYLLINIITVIVSYKCFKSILNDNKYALFTTTIYSISTYRIMDLIVRGAMGEILSFIFIPIIMLGLYEILYRDQKRWYLLSIGFVLLLLSHLITSVLVGIITLIIIIFNYKKIFKEKDRLKSLILSGIVGLFLGAFFVLPIIEQYFERNIQIFTDGSTLTMPYDFRVTFLELFIPKELLIKNIGYGLYILLPIIYLYYKEKKQNNNINHFANILIITGLICCLFTTAIFPWKYIGKYLTFIQFPWRLLIVATPFIALGLTIYMMNIKNKKSINIIKKLSVISVIISIIMATGYISVYTFLLKRPTKFEPSIGTGEYLISGTKLNTDNINSNKDFLFENNYKTNNSELIFTYKKEGKNINITYKNNTKNNTYIEVPLFNYKGYKAKGAKIKNGNNNVIRLVLKDKQGKIKVYYDMTFIQKISYVISSISWIIFIFYLVTKKRNN